MDWSGFDWDVGNRAKCAKHGVSMTAVETMFRGDVRLAPDIKHSGVETRWIAVGRSHEGRGLFVAFTLRSKAGGLFIRPISAR